MPACRPAMAACSSACATSLRPVRTRQPVQSQRAAPDRQRRRDRARRGRGPQLWPHARRERRRRHQGLRRSPWQSMQPCQRRSSRRPATNTAANSAAARSSTATGHRRQFPDLPDAADHPAAEPEPARSARHQPVHRAARAVRRRRAAAKAERSARQSLISSAEERAGDPGAGLCRQHRRRRRQHGAVRRLDGHLEFQGAKGHQRHDHHHQCGRTDGLYRHLYAEQGNASFVWDGKGNDGTQWPAGNYTLTATGKDVRRQQRGDLHRSPGRGRFGRSHGLSAAAFDRRPELHHRPDQARGAPAPPVRASKLQSPLTAALTMV